MRLSVLFPYRDAAFTISNALDSIAADLLHDDELVAIDDGSVDDGPSIVAELARRDPRIVCLRSERRGIVAALGAGVRASSGGLLARMDADDVSLPGRIAASRALLDSDPDLGAVGTQIDAFVSTPGATPADGTLRYVRWQNAIQSKTDHANAIYVESPLCHPSTTIRRTALEAVGGYRDVPWPEDWDLWLRMHQAGFGFAKVPRPLLRWRRHAGSTTAADPRLSRAALDLARATYLARDLAADGRPFAIWGAGRTGKRLARSLERHGAAPRFFVDVDPQKRLARGADVLQVAEGLSRSRAEKVRLVVAVGAPGARDLVRERLARAGVAEGVDFVCAA